MDSSSVYAALGEIFSDVFRQDDIGLRPEMTAADIPGWDSFRQIEIVMASEERFGMKFSARDLENLKCVGDLAALIARRV